MRGVIFILAAIIAASCNSTVSSSPDGGDAGQDSDTEHPIPLSGVEILLVVDNSTGSQDEMPLLSHAAHDLVQTLTMQARGWPFDPIDDLRIAAVSIDMGLSWGGQPYEEGDGWPASNSYPCTSLGDNGRFSTYGSGVTWGQEAIACPEMSGQWIETPNEGLSDMAACLVTMGPGCSFEQQLQSMATSITRDDQSSFFHGDSLLAIITSTNDVDCSIEDGPAFFATDEVQSLGTTPSQLGLACGAHPEHMFSIDHYVELLRDAKGGATNAVIYAAIAGVPPNSTCQGDGVEITGCLEDPAMELTPVLGTNSAGQDSWSFNFACQREGITSAHPSRRVVEMAQRFDDQGYIFSVCNEDWSPAVNDIANMIGKTLEESP